MSLDEFTQMMTNAGVVNESFGNKEISIQFNLAIMTQPNEIESDRHMMMFFPEFIEAIARVAEKLSLRDDEEQNPQTRRQGMLRGVRQTSTCRLGAHAGGGRGAAAHEDRALHQPPHEARAHHRGPQEGTE